MPAYVLTLLAIVAAFTAAALVVALAHAVVRRALDTMDVVSAENRKALQERAVGLMRALRLLAFGVAAFGSISFGLARFGITEQTWDPRSLVRWMLTHGVNLVVIIAGAAGHYSAASEAAKSLEEVYAIAIEALRDTPDDSDELDRLLAGLS